MLAFSGTAAGFSTLAEVFGGLAFAVSDVALDVLLVAVVLAFATSDADDVSVDFSVPGSAVSPAAFDDCGVVLPPEAGFFSFATPMSFLILIAGPDEPANLTRQRAPPSS
ncbi:hypothetical protein AB2B41_12820 [Marimonas sp. MJW-29]|uniref:Secreted protein n=1 Tax=Sulfitobacter sediminis TaxID=3234186 RepID=A0ABV3RNE3_9RHOB